MVKNCRGGLSSIKDDVPDKNGLAGLSILPDPNKTRPVLTYFR